MLRPTAINKSGETSEGTVYTVLPIGPTRGNGVDQEGTLKGEAGPADRMTAVEKTLLNKGFKRVYGGVTGTDVKTKEYSRRNLHGFLVGPQATVILTWRE